MTLSELIARLEAATEGSRELDAEIFGSLGTHVLEKRGRDKKAWWYKIGGADYDRLDPCPYGGGRGVPRFTTSIDAATSLEPPRSTAFESGDTIAGAWARCVVTDENLETHEYTAHHSKEPIARCIAALKARAAQ